MRIPFAVDVIAAFLALDAESLARAITNYVRRPLKILIDTVDAAVSTAGQGSQNGPSD